MPAGNKRYSQEGFQYNVKFCGSLQSFVYPDSESPEIGNF